MDRQVVSQVSHVRASKVKKIDNTFKTNQDGRLMVDEADSDEEKPKEQEISEDYYKQSLASEVSFTRTADGRVKFLKRKREEDDAIVENGIADKEVGKRWHAGRNSKPDAKKEDFSKMLGRQYKSNKAKGDVKRAGAPDPYAYIPLTGKIVGNMNKSTKLDGNFRKIIKAAKTGGEVDGKSRPIRTVKGVSKQNKKHNK